MVLECALFWVWGWLCMELYWGRFVATQLAIVLSLLLTLTIVLLLLGLDLLAVFIGSVYSSVFVAVALIALQFGPFWAVADRVTAGTVVASWLRIWVVVVLSLGSWVCVKGSASLLGWEGLLLWQDLSDELTCAYALQSVTLHWFFFRCFILETLALNLYLFLGLVGVVMLLLTRSVNQRLTLRSAGVTSGNDFHRIRISARLRRQVRRTNASRLKHQR